MVEIDFDFIVGIDLVFVWRSKWLVFSIWIENSSVFVWGHRSRLDIRVDVEIDLISGMESKLPWFLCAGSK